MDLIDVIGVWHDLSCQEIATKPTFSKPRSVPEKLEKLTCCHLCVGMVALDGLCLMAIGYTYIRSFLKTYFRPTTNYKACVPSCTLVGLFNEYPENEYAEEESTAMNIEQGDFTRIQVAMLKDVMHENATRQLDPARCLDAEKRFKQTIEWCWASDDKIRFGHEHVSDHFIHGEGAGKSLKELVEKLVNGRVKSDDLPALVAANYKGKKYVVCGNRRLKCYKDALEAGHDCQFKVIVHDMPHFPTIQNDGERLAFIAKAIYSIDTQNDGRFPHVRKKRRLNWSIRSWPGPCAALINFRLWGFEKVILELPAVCSSACVTHRICTLVRIDFQNGLYITLCVSNNPWSQLQHGRHKWPVLFCELVELVLFFLIPNCYHSRP